MATSTLIQYLGNPGGTASDTEVMNRRQVETFIAGGTIVLNDWVAFSVSATGSDRVLTITQAANVALGNPLVCGVAVSSAEVNGALTAGSKINVVVGGYVEKANVDGAVVAGSPLTVDTTAGQAHVAVTGDISICGVALAADVANIAPVWVYKQF